MLAEIAPFHRPPVASPWLPPSPREPSPRQERAWREVAHEPSPRSDGINVVASRWTDERTSTRLATATCLADRYVIGVALRPVRLRMGRGDDAVFEGTMSTGTVHVTEPGQTAEAEFFTPCDFVHFQVAAGYFRDRQAVSSCELSAANEQASPGERSMRNLVVHDKLAAQLSRTLTVDLNGGDPFYAESVGRTILMRVLAQRPPAPRVGALPKWRMRRVREHLVANVSEPISLADLADAAGLSRVHFATQFRVATGCRPHDYLFQHGIECAKQMLIETDTSLVEVALNVGFQTQSHFSTVFKRLAGDTPARWQRANHIPKSSSRRRA